MNPRRTAHPIPAFRALLAVLAILTLGVSCGLSTGDIESSKEVGIREEAPASIESLRIEVRAGRLTLQTGDANSRRIEVEGELVVNGRDEAEAAQRTERLDLTLTTEGEEAVLAFSAPKNGNPRAEVTVTLPPDVDLDLRMGAGTIESRLDLPASTSIELAAGDILILLAADASARVEAGAVAGEVQVEGLDTSGPVERQIAGARFVGTIGDPSKAEGHELLVRSSAGRIRMTRR